MDKSLSTRKQESPSIRSAEESTAGVRLIIPSNTEYVRVVRLAVLGVASRMSFSFEDIEDIKLAVSEACNNAILHARTASGESGNKAPVEVLIVPFDDRLEIEVADGGSVAPPLLKPRGPHIAQSSNHDIPESGLGLFLMQTLMDKVEHSTSGALSTTVRMVKFLPGDITARIPDSLSAGSSPASRKAGSSAGV